MALGLRPLIMTLLVLALALPVAQGSPGASPVTITGTIEDMQPMALDWEVRDSELNPQASATITSETSPPRYILTLTFHESFNTTTISIYLSDGARTINRTFTGVREWETIHANITAKTQYDTENRNGLSRQVSSPTTEENEQQVEETIRQARLKNLSYFEERYNVTPSNTSKQAYRAESHRRPTVRRELVYKPDTRNVLVGVLTLISIALAGYYVHLLLTR